MKRIYLFLTFKIITNITGVALILFSSAGTLYYPSGWILIGLLIIAIFIYIPYMLRKYPELLKKRLIYKEKNVCQQIVILLSLVTLIAMLCTAGFSFRYNWWYLSVQRYFVSLVIVCLAAILFFHVIRENSFLTSEITVQEDQTVIQSGPYRIVRHPMYAAMLLFLIATDLILGSILPLLVSTFFIPILILRILNEEKMLNQKLAGYKEYTQKVKYRIIPFVW